MSDKVDISGTIKVEDQASPTIRRIQQNIGKITESAKKVGAGFSRFANMGMLGGVAKNARNAAGAIGTLGKSIFSIGGKIAAIAGVAGFGGLAYELQNYVNSTDQLAKASERIGINVEQLQMLRHAADLSGVSAETLDASLEGLNRRLAISAAAKKPDELGQMMARLGISLRDNVTGQVRSAADVLPQLANAFNKNTNAAVRTRMATVAFGKGGTEMINMLAAGGPELRKMMEEMVKLGIITKEQAKQAEELNDAQGRMNRAIKGVSNAIVAAFVPGLTKAADATTEWVAANREWISAGVTQAMTDLGSALAALPWDKVLPPLKEFGAMLAVGFKAIGGWNTVLPALAIILTGVLLSGLYSVTAAVIALNVALLSNPIVWVIGLVAALAFGAYMLWKHWDKVKQFFIDLWPDIRKAFWDALGWLRTFATTFTSGFIRDAWNPLVEWFGKLWADIKATFWGAVAWVGEFAGQFIPEPLKVAWDAMIGWFGTLWAGIKATFWAALAWVDEFIGKFIPGGLTGAWSAVAKFFETMWAQVTGFFDAAWQKIQTVVGWIKGAVEPLLALIGKLPSATGTGPPLTVEQMYGGGGTAETAAQTAQRIYGGAPEAAAKTAAQLYGSAPDTTAATAAQLYGGVPAPMPAAVSPVQDAQQAAPPVARVDGEVKSTVKVELAPGLIGTATTQDRGRVTSSVDVGTSMVPA